MNLQISSIGSTPVPLAADAVTSISRQAAAKVAATPPPPPPPPPPARDVVTLTSSIKQLQSEGESPDQIAQALGLPLQTVSIDLGTSFIEATLDAAPNIPSAPSVVS